MKFKKVFSVVALMLSILVLGVGCGESKSEESERVDSSEASYERPKKLRLADTGLEGMEELQRTFGPFKEALEEILDLEVEFFPVSDRTIATTAMEFGQVDLVLAGPSEYAQMKSALPKAEALASIQRAKYNAVIIVREDSPYKTLEDIKGAKIAMKDAGSTSGHIGPSAILVEAGFDLDNDVEILLLADARIEAFKNGEVDVLATGIKDFDKMVEEDGEGKYRILVEGPPLPADPIVAAPHLPEEFVEELKARILENREALLESILASGERDKYQLGGIIEAKDSDYDLMRETYRVLGIDL